MTTISNNIVNTQQNKGYLWKILHENGAFNNIDNKHVQEIKNTFEKIVEDNIINFNSNNFDTTKPNFLLICNKIIIEQMINVLQSYKNDLLPNKINTNINNEIPVNKPDINSNNYKQSFEERLKEKQEDFNKLIEKPLPPDINFADNNDDKPIDIENNLNNLKKQRNYIDEKIDFKKNLDDLTVKVKEQDNLIKILLQKINDIEIILNKNNTINNNKSHNDII